MHPSLQGLAAYRQFILYRVQPSTSRPGKQDKLPCDITGRVVSAHDPANWMDAATAYATATAFGDGWGVGFVFTDGDPFFFLDIDNCLVDGHWSELAVSLCSLFAGCAVEVSQSGRGLHIFGVGRPPAHGTRNQALGLEFYTAGRFVALTGHNAQGSVMHDASAVLPGFVTQYFPVGEGTSSEPATWAEAPVPEWRGPTEDQDLIRRAMNSKSAAAAFSGGTKASFSDLWLGNVDVLARAFPDGGGRPYDASAADAALAQHLSFWTGKDCERIRRIMLLPANALRRDKYEREDYLPRTILGAVGRGDVCQDREAAPVTTSLTVPSGSPDAMTPEDFWAHLPSHKYINTVTRQLIPVDAINGSLKVWEATLGMKPSAYLDAQRAVQDMSWNPGYPELIEGMVSDKGVLRPDPKGRIYNLYRASDAVGTDADVTVWLDHVKYFWPTDWEHLINWYAQRLQQPGTKVNHALVIGGNQGIGKDLMLDPIRYGVGEVNYSDLSPETLLEPFNDWVESTMIVINEASDLGDTNRYKFYESCKRIIAAPPDSFRCNKKNIGAYYVPNVMGVIFTSNHKLTGIYIDADDRRHYVAWSPKLKLDTNYYRALATWLENGGRQAVVGYLRRLDISQWNPKAPPAHTEAWHQIVAAQGNPDEVTLGDVLQGVTVATVKEIIAALQFQGQMELVQTITDKRNSRRMPAMLERVGFEAVKNPYDSDGRWRLSDGRKETLYAARTLTPAERIQAAEAKARS